jgi:hypothetical protein
VNKQPSCCSDLEQLLQRFPWQSATLSCKQSLLLPCRFADLALPGIAGILFHGTWSILITAQVATIGLPDDCPQRSWASSSILWLLASFVLTTALQVWVTAASLRGKSSANKAYSLVLQLLQLLSGSIALMASNCRVVNCSATGVLQAGGDCTFAAHHGCVLLCFAGGMLEEHKRASVPTAMCCLLSAYCLEAAALTYTTVVFEGLVGDTDKCYTAEELARFVVFVAFCCKCSGAVCVGGAESIA